MIVLLFAARLLFWLAVMIDGDCRNDWATHYNSRADVALCERMQEGTR